MKGLRYSAAFAIVIWAILITGFVWLRGGSSPSPTLGSVTRTREPLSTARTGNDHRPAETARRLEGMSVKGVMEKLSDRSAAERDEILSILCAECGRTDPELALQYAREITAAPLRRENVSLTIAFLFDRDPKAALTLLQSEQDPEQRAAIETRLLPAMADADAPAVIDLLAAGTMEAPHSPLLLATTVQRWAAQDAAAAAQWSTGIEDGELQTIASTTVASTWGAHDPAELEAWLGAHPEAQALSAAYFEWKHPTTSEQREQLANQSASVPDGSVSEPCPSEPDPH